MNKKMMITLLLISSGLLAAAALIFFGLSIFEETGNNHFLQCGLVCCLLSNLFGAIRHQLNKEK